MSPPPPPADDEVMGRVYDARLARRLLRYVRPYGGLVAAAVVLLCVEGGLQLVGPVLTRHVIDVALPAGDAAGVTRAALILAGTLVLQFVAGYGETVLTGLLGQRVMRDLRTELFARLQRLPVAFYDRSPVGRLVTRVTSDVEALNELFTAGVVAGLGDLFTLVAIGVMMLVVDWQLALAAFAVMPFVLLASRLFQTRVRGAYREIRTRLARINAFVQERLSGLRIVQLFGREGDERARFRRLNDDHLDAHLRSIRIYALYFPAIEILTTVALASLIVAAASRVGAGTLTVGTVAAFLQLVRRFFQPLQDLSEKFNILQGAMAASERIFALLDEPVEEYGAPLDARRSTLAPSAGASVERRASSGEGLTVEFDDVWFTYGDPAAADPQWVLRGVSFRVAPGETLALVGHTGAGKTTIVSLLLRFYAPQRGRILVDGVDVRELSLDALRSRVGFVQQDIFLFAGDVAGNVRLGAPLTDEEVAAAAARVGADRVVARLPHGWRQELGERGASLSVGERQLLAFARAVAADPALLVLDEATSAVDSEAEARIQAALETLMRGRTTIAIAHRLSTIVAADQILVLHHGQVVERGRHAALLARDGLYARLYRLQVAQAAEAARPAA
ncbi:ABC transporter ATP-binding protein [Roseisolibacter sp. H3M3-2]|uniref:ABC transporter ATP-binding protein n=1 Tax=Roseisolibacter sp. H3M3-2 TaxID=3031323 RepID=UPI0023D97C78|nr:ABC transporter ATP-binding protein [Roseisolibacter sp. H3M3-2]MDF1502073.1 ABC transporter ATP-binding protein [Roseisolibacter sp. H3M3-2]